MTGEKQDFPAIPIQPPQSYLGLCASDLALPNSAKWLLVYNVELLTMATDVVIGFLRLLCSLEVFFH